MKRMANEYDIEITSFNTSSDSTSDNHLVLNNNHNNNDWDIDTATIVSITSSCIILISGCIAVICLVLYMKKTDNRYRSSNRTCAKCGHGLTTTSSNESNPIRSESIPIIIATNDEKKPSLAVLRGQQSEALLSKTNRNENCEQMRGKLPQIIRQIENNKSIEVNETNPYAISNFDETKLKTEFAQTFSGLIGEPAYIVKSSMSSAPPLPIQSQCHSQCSSNHEELIRCYEFGRQQNLRLNPITSSQAISCFDDELDFYREDTPTDPGIREFTKSPPKPNERRQGIVFHQKPEQIRFEHSFNELDSISVNAEKSVSSNNSSDEKSTTSNETTTPINFSNENFGAIPRDRSRKPSWKLCMSSATMKSSSLLGSVYMKDESIMSGFKEGLSSDELEEEDEEYIDDDMAEEVEEETEENTLGTKFKYFKVETKQQNEREKQKREENIRRKKLLSNKSEIDC